MSLVNAISYVLKRFAEEKAAWNSRTRLESLNKKLGKREKVNAKVEPFFIKRKM